MSNTLIKGDEIPRTSKFSIDDILEPEFGRKQIENRLKTFYSNYNHILSRVARLKPYQCCLREIACNTSERANATEPLDRPTGKQTSSTINCSLSSRIKDQNCSRLNSDNSSTGPRHIRDDLKANHTDVRKIEADCTRRSDDQALPAWVYCTRYSDRPSSGPRSRKIRRAPKPGHQKRPRTSFSGDQLKVLQTEFGDCPYLTENRRQSLASNLCLNESQIKIWFQNKRAKAKKTLVDRNGLTSDNLLQKLQQQHPQYKSDTETSDR